MAEYISDANHANKENAIDTTNHDALNYYIFGHNIAHSLSPAMHNAGFKKLGLPGLYKIHETEAVDSSVETLINQPSFAGASVTFPHKLQIEKLMNETTQRAIDVGAVNTILVKRSHTGRILVGDNTDWSGITACIIKSGVRDLKSSSAVVLGAGGAARAACYALQTLGISEVVIVNRTTSRAKDMASHFPKLRTQSCMALKDAHSLVNTPIRVIVACVPADDLGIEKIPNSLFQQSRSGVLVEMAYRPLSTGMMEMAAKYPEWRVFRGMDVLKEQAAAQFKLWTGEDPPLDTMGLAMETEVERRRMSSSVL
jgi:shikimate-5-dehydrogenase